MLRTRWAHQVRVACSVEDGEAALDTLGLGAAGRATALDVGDAPPDRRVGAAYLLAKREDREGPCERVRLAMEACADEDTRHALELAAEGEASGSRGRAAGEGLLSRRVPVVRGPASRNPVSWASR